MAKGIQIVVINKAEYRKILREFPRAGHTIINDVVADTTLHVEQRALNYAPFGTSGNLRQGFRRVNKPAQLYGEVQNIEDYAESVHDGGIPQPNVGRTAESRTQLYKWRQKKAPHIPFGALISSLRRRGIQWNTPFFTRAAGDITQKFINSATRRAVHKFNKGLVRK